MLPIATPIKTTPTTAPPLRQRLSAAWRQHRGWLWGDVVAVFISTRLGLLLVAWFASIFPRNTGYLVAGAAARGWQFTPVWLLDVWGRWDSGWYFNLINHGYYAPGPISTVQSNLAFLPVYPYLVKALAALAPVHSPGATLLAGVLVSNGFLVGALVLMRQWVARLLDDEAAARRTVLYVLLFPTGFFFSAFYAESTFLFFAMAALYAAQRRAWSWAFLAGAVLTLTRPPGIFIGLPLVWQYAEAAQWNIRNLRPNFAWMALMPASLLAFFSWQYLLTNDFLALLHSEGAWWRSFSWPWNTLLHPQNVMAYMTPLEQWLTVIFVAGALVALWRLPSVSLGLFALLLIVPPLFTGELLSTSRIYLVAIPVFVVLAQWGKHPTVDKLITIVSPMAQAMLFFVWCLFYFVA